MSLLPMSEHNRIIFGVVGSALVLFIMWTQARRHLGTKLPPGPPLDFFIGGLRTMPTEQRWETFAEWAKNWGGLLVSLLSGFLVHSKLPTGDIVYTSLFGTPIIVINSIDSARDLLDKRGSNFSDRPRAVVRNEM